MNQFSKLTIFVLLLALGITLNYATVSLVEPVQFIFTPVALFVGARTLSLRWSLLLTLVVLAHLSITWGSINNPLLYFLQWVAYQFAARRNWNFIITDIIYWAVIGVPIAALVTLVVYQQPVDALSLTILLKQPVNGLVCVLVANLLVVAPWINKVLSKKLYLQSFIKDVLLAVLFLPLLVVFFLTKISLAESNSDSVKKTNNSYALLTKNRIEAFLSGYEKSVKTLAEMLSGTNWQTSDQVQPLLSSTHKIHDGFLTMLIADTSGNIRFSSPPQLVSTGTNVKDRNYFQFPETMMLSYISDVFRGRGFGVDPIVAISAPIANSAGAFDGIVEGSLDLYKFDFLLFMPEEIPTEVLILDNSEQVIFASEGLSLSFLQKVDLTIHPDELYGNTLTINQNTTRFTYAYQTIGHGWSVIFLNERSFHIKKLGQAYVDLLTFTLIISFVLLALAHFLARKINRPIRKLLSRYSAMSQLQDDIKFKKEDSIFSEIQLLFEQFDVAFSNMVKAHHKQQESLAEKIAAEEKDKAKSELLSKVSHELRTPLNAILGQVQLLMMEQQSNLDNQQLQKIEQAGKFLVFLIDDLLLLSKSELDELTVVCQSVDLTKVIKTAVDLLQENIRVKSINLTLTLDGVSDVVVSANELRLQQVFANLISNAVKYNYEGGSVEITAQTKKNIAVISIVDSGFGIPQEYRTNLFQPFNRLAQEHGDIEGSGIGLALAKQLLTAMNASIEYSPRSNGGSCFTIRLALSQTEVQSESESEIEGNLSLENRSVLYVEDNQTNFLIMSAWLKKKGCDKLNRAETGEEGIASCQSNRYDLILVDLGLPDMSGLELFDVIKKEQPNAVIVALTADNSDTSRTAALEKGFDAFLTKPVIFDEVERVIAHLIANV